MKIPKLFIIQLLILLPVLFSCTKQAEVGEIKVSRILMDSAFDSSANSPMTALVDSFKTLMDVKIHEEIGFADVDLVKGKPQSLLGNFAADAMFDFGNKKWGKIDFAISNIGGIRGTLNKGKITVGELYEIFPFENEIVMLELKGKFVKKLFDAIAVKSGEALSKNIECVINGKNVESLKIGGKRVEDRATYRIVTINYLAEGNDGMTALADADSTLGSGVLIRDMLIAHIKNLTADGKNIESKLDNRIRIK
jgi:2',3'-cyclic-nucleotide 2'-phosphodiesterase (5'-nucleotidase family)